MAIEAVVRIPGRLSDDEKSELATDLSAFGLETLEVDADSPRVVGIDDALIAAVIVVPLAAFFHEIGKRAAGDAYDGFKRLLTRLRRRHNDAGIVVIQDEESGARVDITPQLSEAALMSLTTLDYSSLGECTLTWDNQSGSWVESD